MVTIKKEPKNKGLGPVTSCCLSVSILWIVVSFVMIFLDDNGSYLLDVQHESFDTKVHPPLIGSFRLTSLSGMRIIAYPSGLLIIIILLDLSTLLLVRKNQAKAPPSWS